MTRKTTSWRKELLLGTVAVVAGVSLASAQGLREGGPAGASEHGTTSRSSQMSPPSGDNAGAKAAGTKSDDAKKIQAEGATGRKGSRAERQLNHGQAQREESPKGSKTLKGSSNGQAKGEQRGRSTTGQGSAEKSEHAKDAAEEKSKAESKKKENATSGQGAVQGLKKNESTATGQAPSSRSSEASKVQPSQGQSSSPQQPAQAQTQGGQQNQATGTSTQTQQNASKESGATVRSQAGATVTAQQQTTIQQDVLSARNAPRVDRVDFDVRTNAVVPSHVHFARLSAFPVLVDVFPRYRHDSFFVVEDEIVIVEPRAHRIVDVVPVGPRAHYSRASSTSTTMVDLSEPEIREVQHVLIDRGFLRGRVTGVWDERTRVALVAFQRRKGFEASGRIDTRTVTALGLSGRINVPSGSASQSSSSTSTPQTQGGTQQPSAQHTTSGQSPASSQSDAQNAPAQSQSQGSSGTTPNASTQPGQNGSPSATTGQGAGGPPKAQPSGGTPSQPSSGSTQKKSDQR